jgi:hypothetical protein
MVGFCHWHCDVLSGTRIGPVRRGEGLPFDYGPTGTWIDFTDLRSREALIRGLMRAVSSLLAKSQAVIKTLRTRQPVLSKIDEKLLVEVAGVERSQATFLGSDFLSYWRTPAGKT